MDGAKQFHHRRRRYRHGLDHLDGMTAVWSDGSPVSAISSGSAPLAMLREAATSRTRYPARRDGWVLKRCSFPLTARLDLDLFVSASGPQILAHTS